LKIAGRVAFLTLFSGYQPSPAIVATHPLSARRSRIDILVVEDEKRIAERQLLSVNRDA